MRTYLFSSYEKNIRQGEYIRSFDEEFDTGGASFSLPPLASAS